MFTICDPFSSILIELILRKSLSRTSKNLWSEISQHIELVITIEDPVWSSLFDGPAMTRKFSKETNHSFRACMDPTSKKEGHCDIIAHTVILYVLFCLTYMYCTLYILHILYTVHIVHVPCFPVSDITGKRQLQKSLWFLYLCTHYVERYKIAQRVYK